MTSHNYLKKNFILLFFSFILTLMISFNVNAQSNATVSLDSIRQVIRGFGAANIVGWRPDMTVDEINTAFGTGDGQLGFSILRFRIPPDQGSFSVNLPSAQLAYSMGVTLIASPWSPPASMKTNNNTVGGELKETSYGDFALYLKSFADYMSDNSAPIYAISIQNEPDVSVTYESCDYNASQMLKFVKENASSIGTKVMAPESYHFARALSDPLLNDTTALANFDIVSGHIYGSGLAPYPLAESKGKEVWMTEHYTESAHSGNDWPLALDVAKEINDCMKAGMSAYVWWYIVRYYGPIGDGNNNTIAGEITKRGYIMSQYSRFIRPGFLRVDVDDNPQAGVYLTAYRSDDQVVIVAVNTSTSSKTQMFTLKNGGVSLFTPYVTSQTKNCTQESSINVSNKTFSATLDASSITTFVSNIEPGLPVELISFNANVVANKVSLTWSTATETNNAGFEIQRSIDGKEFVTVGYVEGKGTTAKEQFYSYTEEISDRHLYYRLKQVDYNGSSKYSEIVEVDALPLTYSLSQNYPNPFNPTTQIKYSVPADGFISLKVYNLLGEEVATLFEGMQTAGNYLLTFDASGVAGGVYLYQLKSSNFVETKKLILLK